MHEPKGRIIPLSGPRRFINDLVYFGLRRVPSVPLSRTADPRAARRAPRVRAPVAAVVGDALHEGARPGCGRARAAPPRDAHLALGRGLYEHPADALLAGVVERVVDGEYGVFVGVFPYARQAQSIGQIRAASVETYKNDPDRGTIGYFRQGDAGEPAPAGRSAGSSGGSR